MKIEEIKKRQKFKCYYRDKIVNAVCVYNDVNNKQICFEVKVFFGLFTLLTKVKKYKSYCFDSFELLNS